MLQLQSTDLIDGETENMRKILVDLFNSTCGLCMDADLAPKTCGIEICCKIQSIRIELQHHNS